MPKRRTSERAFGKALALWEAPSGAGEARVCVATTFTFDASFFETECLGRFLGMDGHPAESDAVSYLVEREEKLATSRVAVLVDRIHARDKESLRWDVLGVLASTGIQHSKISLLAWASHVRVIVGSGNLTEPGYRKNLEVFGAIDLSRQHGGDQEGLSRTLDFLAEVAGMAVGTDTPTSPKRRVLTALDSVRNLVDAWPDSGPGQPKVIFGGPGRSILTQLSTEWPSGSPPRTAHIVSPFFDNDGIGVAKALLSVLAKRRPRDIYFIVRAEGRPDGRTRVCAPLNMVKYAAGNADVEVLPVLAEQDGELRDLHAKVIHLLSDRWRVVLAGSSNFTRAGLGVAGGQVNFEANLVYLLKSSDADVKVLDSICPEYGEALDIESELLVWDPRGEQEEGGEGTIPLPGSFVEAMFDPGSPSNLRITLARPLPSVWVIRTVDGRELLSSAKGVAAGEHKVTWDRAEVPLVLEVSWSHSKGDAAAHWPVNVSNPAALPPPEALRSLTLEEMLEVLASTRPIPQAVADVFAKRKGKTAKGDEEIDPLRRHDSQAFLLRRTKRLAAALERLRERLERPASSREALEWRLSGPIGPLALAEGYARESVIPGEAKFCLAEIALALCRVRPTQVAADGLPPALVSKCLSEAIKELAKRAKTVPSAPELDIYAAAAFQEALG